MKKEIIFSGNSNDALIYATAVFIPEGNLTKEDAKEIFNIFSSVNDEGEITLYPPGQGSYSVERLSYNTFFKKNKIVIHIAYNIHGHGEKYYSFVKRDAENLIEQLETLLVPFDE